MARGYGSVYLPDLNGFRGTFTQFGANAGFYPAGALTTSRPMITAVPAQDTLYTLPFISGRGGALDTIAFRQLVNGGAGEFASVGIYNPSATNSQYPGTLLVESASFDVSAGGSVLRTTAISVSLAADALYWFAFLCGLGAAAPTIRVIDLTAPGGMMFPIHGLIDGGLLIGSGTGYSPGSLYGGGMPDPYPAGVSQDLISPAPVIAVRFA